jgi:two-component system sensor histidine kinase/response regulator
VDSTAPARMLVVDDDPRSLKLLAGFLRAEGYDVRTASDGRQALDRAAELPPDVVLLDVMMPELTGHEVCRHLKSDPRTRSCQVMLVTALASTPDQVKGLDTGADDYIPKPVRREEFLAKVRALVRARRLLDELEAARDELARRIEELQLKKTLAQTLVHDLKSPLTAVLGNLDLLKQRGAAELHPLIDRSQQGARRMLKMILNLLDIEELEEGRMKPASEQVELVQLIRSAVDEAQVTAGQKRVSIEIEGAPAVWSGSDPVLVRRVLDNLLSNAVTHTPGGGRIEVRAGYREEGAEVVIGDSGPGIPEELREKVFEKYARGDVNLAGLTMNRGLGLTFCRMAVEVQGGSIWIESAPGGGTCVRIVLPAAPELGPEQVAMRDVPALQRE